jgi:para-aminobenzoate synthetase component 1
VNSDSDPFDVYRRLRRLNPAPYGAYLNFGNYQVLSTSPERMFLKQGNQISTSPIKGTIANGSDLSSSELNRSRLLQSEKDRAELLMIVDLERNDLGRIAQTGSVQVERLFKAEIYSSLIHLVSDISAELRHDVKLKDILNALMPGGSITGAPKKRAVEIIADMERDPRSVYTGCIGYVDGDTADFNIAIRTMIHSGGQYHVHAGGGIVADSDPVAEYEEMLLKARNLLRALGVQTGVTNC